jgi:hypothetical protein
MPRFIAGQYKEQNHPTKPNEKIFLNSNEDENFTVVGKEGLWKYYYESDGKSKKPSNSRPCVLCVQKLFPDNPNSEKCNYSTRFEHDLDENHNIKPHIALKHQTHYKHNCGK